MYSASAAVAEQLPVEAFAKLPTISQVLMSPDGENVAALINIDTEEVLGTAVRVFNMEERQATTVAYAEAGDFVVNWISWANNEYLLVSARFPAVRYGVPVTETRLLSININTRDIVSVFSPNYLRKQDHVPQFQDGVIDLLPDDDDNILVAVGFQSFQGLGVYEVNVTKNKVRKVKRERGGIIEWITDQQHRLRVAIWRDDTEYEIQHQGPDGGGFEALWEFEAFSDEQVWPMSFGKDPDVLYVRAYHEGRLAVFRVRMSDPELKRELVFSDPDYDATGSLIYSNVTGEVIGIRYLTNGGYTFWDESYQKLQDVVDDALPDTSNRIYSLSDNERRYIALATSDTDAGTYYIGDRDQKQLMQFASRYSALPAELMSEKRYVSYEARDGLEIEGYLTLPNGGAAENLPTIIFPHGGPISFDGGGFDYWTQYFANRGYAVLQMNFRGSAGYGYDFMKSGLQAWGLEMQNDVEDGTRWMIEEGIADPDRICVVGASYGGYAALMEAARNPDLYQCAVSFAGVTDVAYLVSSSRRYTNFEIVKEQIGSDYSELRKRSPLYVAEAIDVPVLLGHGTKDRSVRVRHSQRMSKELEKEDKDVIYVELEDGDHYLSQQAHRIEFFQAMEAFLQEHL
jgi:dipeptidyl aminopeptidase/acylaminoacyl peptidase